MTADQKQRANGLLSAWRATAYALHGDRMAALLQELADGYDAPESLAATNPSQISSSAEPFGYFKAEPFGWTDCAETDDGAIALYTAPPAPIYNAPAYMATHDAWRGLEPFLGKDVPDSEVVLLSDVKAMLTTPPATDQSEQHLGMVPADVEAINSIDARFCGRLALILECVILDPHGHFDLACQLLEEYKAEWEKVNPSPPTFMGEPMPPERRARLLEMKAKRNEQEQSE